MCQSVQRWRLLRFVVVVINQRNMPLHTRTANLSEALMQEVVLNSPLIQRRKGLRIVKDEEDEAAGGGNRGCRRKKGLGRFLGSMVTSLRNVVVGVLPFATAKETSIPMVDCMAARGNNSRAFLPP